MSTDIGVTPEMLAAWVAFDPVGQFSENISFARFNGMMRHAFMSGYVAALPEPDAPSVAAPIATAQRFHTPPPVNSGSLAIGGFDQDGNIRLSATEFAASGTCWIDATLLDEAKRHGWTPNGIELGSGRLVQVRRAP